MQLLEHVGAWSRDLKMCENVAAPSLALMQPRPWWATNGSLGEHDDPTV